MSGSSDQHRLFKNRAIKTGPRQATALAAETPGTTEGAGNWQVGLAGALDHGLVSWIADTSASTLYLRHILSIDHSSHVDSPVSSLYVYTAPATRRVRTTRAAELTNMPVTLWERAFNQRTGERVLPDSSCKIGLSQLVAFVSELK